MRDLPVDALAERYRDGVVHDRLDVEPDRVRATLEHPPLEEEQIGPRHGHLPDVDVGLEVGGPRLVAKGVVQPPRPAALRHRLRIEEEAVAAARREAEDGGRVRGVQGRGDRRTRHQGLGVRGVEQAERIGAGGVGVAVHAQPVVPSDEGHHLGTVEGFERVGLAERSVGDHGASGAVQGPADARVVRQRIEVDEAVAVECEVVAVGLAGCVEAATDGRDARRKRQRNPRGIRKAGREAGWRNQAVEDELLSVGVGEGVEVLLTWSADRAHIVR